MGCGSRSFAYAGNVQENALGFRADGNSRMQHFRKRLDSNLWTPVRE